jgi:hypothetical protein
LNGDYPETLGPIANPGQFVGAPELDGPQIDNRTMHGSIHQVKTPEYSVFAIPPSKKP